MKALYAEMNAQETKESKLYKALDKLEALIQHNESPLDTWSENEYELNKTYAFDTVEFSFDAMKLKEYFLKELEKLNNVTILYNEDISQVERDNEYYMLTLKS